MPNRSRHADSSSTAAPVAHPAAHTPSIRRTFRLPSTRSHPAVSSRFRMPAGDVPPHRGACRSRRTRSASRSPTGSGGVLASMIQCESHAPSPPSGITGRRPATRRQCLASSAPGQLHVQRFLGRVIDLDEPQVSRSISCREHAVELRAGRIVSHPARASARDATTSANQGFPRDPCHA